jgi:hypothetical protein
MGLALGRLGMEADSWLRGIVRRHLMSVAETWAQREFGRVDWPHVKRARALCATARYCTTGLGVAGA